MGHELEIYGSISAPLSGSRTSLHQRNEATIKELPAEGDWPWLNRSQFALPGPYPHGTYQSQIIHFGFSMKDDYVEGQVVEQWIVKFEQLLAKLYWIGTDVHIFSEFEPCRVWYRYTYTEEALARMLSDEPEPTKDWVREIIDLSDFKS